MGGPRLLRTRHSKIALLCAPRHVTSTRDDAAMSDGTRWLIVYAHSSNGLGNKLGGLRGAFTIAHTTGRRLRIRWHAHQETDLLQPAADASDERLAWAAPDGPGVSNSVDGAAWDAWGRAEWSEVADGPYRSKKPTFLLPKSTRQRRPSGNRSATQLLRTDSELCAPTLHDVHPRNTADLEEARDFAILALGDAPVVVMRSITFDVMHPWTRIAQAEVAKHARFAYQRLFKPTPEFKHHACQHLNHMLNLSFARPWIGLQLRRSQAGAVEDVQTSLGCRLCGPETTWQNETDLSHSDHAGILRAVRCAHRARVALCKRGETRMCDAPVFVTSSSYRVLRRAVQLLGKDARYTANPDFVSHGGARNGYLAPLLELAALSASRVVIGSAGSSFPLEAANLAGATAIIRDFGMYKVAKELRSATMQGSCDDPPDWPPEATGSVLLPRGSC
jgi:hypothetical protein